VTLAIKQTVTIQPGGVVHLALPELREGAQAEVIVLVPDSADAGNRLDAFRALQESLDLTPAGAEKWAADAAAERQAFGAQ
jgi:hypothetical protein